MYNQSAWAITIPANKKTVTKSYKVTVKVKGKASKKFTAKSNKTSVAEVDSIGVIHAVKEGTAIITVTSSNDKTAKYKVIVKSSKKANKQNSQY
ncbi:MAG: Ig-like domain-containing protein [Ruminococcus sp.]|nr:Ig-like domain-containing protein [Ruminococcus sp.]